jgi:hypothetical protein
MYKEQQEGSTTQTFVVAIAKNPILKRFVVHSSPPQYSL